MPRTLVNPQTRRFCPYLSIALRKMAVEKGSFGCLFPINKRMRFGQMGRRQSQNRKSFVKRRLPLPSAAGTTDLAVTAARTRPK
jgi:hypothetical protein